MPKNQLILSLKMLLKDNWVIRVATCIVLRALFQCKVVLILIFLVYKIEYVYYSAIGFADDARRI